MIGNDVVDLGDPETAPGAVHPRFDARVFAPCERAFLAARPQEQARRRWILWAAKEAAYKLARRLEPRTVFAPRAFLVDLEASEVRFGGRRFSLSIDADDDRVHAVVTAKETDGASPTVSGVALAGAAPAGKAARELALRALTPRLGDDRLAIVRDGRIPRLERSGCPLSVALSLSHHGRFVAFAASFSGLS